MGRSKRKRKLFLSGKKTSSYNYKKAKLSPTEQPVSQAPETAPPHSETTTGSGVVLQETSDFYYDSTNTADSGSECDHNVTYMGTLHSNDAPDSPPSTVDYEMEDTTLCINCQINTKFTCVFANGVYHN